MGLLDKVKNIFFEEVESEEETPKKEKITVAKKIETPEVKKVKEEVALNFESEDTFDEEDTFLEDTIEASPVLESRKFPMDFDDDDFEVEKTLQIPVVDEKTEIPREEVADRKPLTRETYLREKVNVEFTEEDEPHIATAYKERIKTYIDDTPSRSNNLYEGKEKKQTSSGFKLSPIISPVYGILDKNYTKEDVPVKKEIRISASSKKVDVDIVREKAYGDLADDITRSIHEEEKPEVKKELTDEELMYDLSEDEPSVKNITVGDAEEYFSDLGLEYNVDYKVTDDKPNINNEESVKEDIDKEEIKEKNNVNDEKDEDDLFDLIDSMYEDKE